MKSILFIFLISLSVTPSKVQASCKEEKETFEKYNKKFQEIKERNCFFPKTEERKPCLETSLGKELRIRKLASQTLLGVCKDS